MKTGRSLSKALEHAVTIADLRALAQRRTPDFVFLPMEQGTGDGRGPLANVASFSHYRFVPRVPDGASEAQLEAELFGRTYAMPIGISAIGYAGKMRAGTDVALAEAAKLANIPFLISGGSVSSLELVSKVAPDHVWQQLYLARDQAITDDFLRRGIACGRDVLVLTVDMPSGPAPDWLSRTGILPPVGIAPRAIPKFLWDILTHPRWTAEHALRGGLPRAESWKRYLPAGSSAASIWKFAHSQITASTSWPEIERVRALWPGRLVLKGLLHSDDVERALRIGADAVTISNHGGNKMEEATTPLDALAEIAGQAGQPEPPLLFDGGIRSGGDVAIALALGSRFSFVGRAALYGALAGGRDGALRAIDILRRQLGRTILHLGVSKVGDLNASMLRRIGPGDLSCSHGRS